MATEPKKTAAPKAAAPKADRPAAPKAAKPAAKAPKAKQKTIAHGHAPGVKVKRVKARRAIPQEMKGTKTGVVESDKVARTRRVVVNYSSKHPKYGKYIRQRTILHVHDEKNESKLGDIVEVAPCRPVSKNKRWELVRVVERRSAAAAALQSVKDMSSGERN
jgi:small subunit ribosomal protein S17